MSRNAATPLIVALSPGHSDISRFRPWSPIATGNHLNRAEKIPKLAGTTGTVDVFDMRSGISGPTSHRASSCPNLGRPGRGASQVKKSPRLNWATQFLTVAYDGACSPNVSISKA